MSASSGPWAMASTMTPRPFTPRFERTTLCSSPPGPICSSACSSRVTRSSSPRGTERSFSSAGASPKKSGRSTSSAAMSRSAIARSLETSRATWGATARGVRQRHLRDGQFVEHSHWQHPRRQSARGRRVHRCCRWPLDHQCDGRRRPRRQHHPQRRLGRGWEENQRRPHYRDAGRLHAPRYRTGGL